MSGEYKVIAVEKEKYDSYTYEIWWNGHKITEWYDGANVHYPEDLCWDKMIGSLFDVAVELGRRIERDKHDQT